MEELFVKRMPPPSATRRLNMSPQKRDQYDDASQPWVARTVPRSWFRTVKVFSFVVVIACVRYVNKIAKRGEALSALHPQARLKDISAADVANRVKWITLRRRS
jgi:hypothetical protein